MLKYQLMVSLKSSKIVMRCAVWYQLYTLKNVKNTHGGKNPGVKKKTSLERKALTDLLYANAKELIKSRRI